MEKMIVWKQYLEDNNIDICSMTETWLKDTNKMNNRNLSSTTIITEFHKFFEDQYIVFTKNRKNQRGRKGHGCIGILIRKNIGIVKKS